MSETLNRLVNQMSSAPQRLDWADIFLKASKYCPQGLILEFGVATGGSTRAIAAAIAPRRMFGFDWWGGLPEDWKDNPRGTFACEMPRDLPENVTLVPGLFDATLEPFLASHAGTIGFLNMDADLYSSTKYVLDRVKDRIVPGTIIHFDEIRGHEGNIEAEGRAFAELIDGSKLTYKLLTLTGTEGALFKMGWK